MKGIAGLVGRMMAMAAVLYAAACTDDRLMGDYGGGTAATEATPVRFEIDCEPLYSVTRAAPKLKEWKNGDHIQIWAQFSGDGMVGADSTKTQYSCYQYTDDGQGGHWDPAEESKEIYWPVGATSGNFSAYYISGLTGAISPGASVGYALGDIQEGEDPLHAKADNLGYGHSVPLHFQHLCAHLTLTKAKAGTGSGYWLYRADGGEEKREGGSEISNAYRLTYTGDSLKFEFTDTTLYRTDEGQHYYIRRIYKGDLTDSVDFYLEPTPNGMYDGCNLTYGHNRPYMTFSDIGELDSLKAGHHYELSLDKQSGVIPQPDPGFPDTLQTGLGGVNIPELLKGIVEGEEDVLDSCNNVVLKVKDEPHPTLMRDVDFKNFNPLDYINENGNGNKDWKFPELSRVFDGNYHSFFNVAYPVFGKVEDGTIYNLAIRNSKSDISAKDIKDMGDKGMLGEMNFEMGDIGLLACVANGRLENILLDSIIMTVHLDSTLGGTGSQNRAFHIGCLAGDQHSEGHITDVELRDSVHLTVTSDSKNMTENEDCYIGTLVGQSEGIIDGVSAHGTCALAVPIQGGSTVYAGGLVGRVTNEVRNAALIGKVDGSGLHVLQAYAGGLLGELVNEKENEGLLESCNAVIAVTGGTVHTVNNTTHPHAYTGGIAAHIKSATCTNVTVAGSVKGGNAKEAETAMDNSDANLINYATGGGFGCIAEEDNGSNDITGCNALTTVTPAQVDSTKVKENETGNFAGISDIGEDELEGAGNKARDNEGLQFIGNEEDEPK